jgi:hypothetical protein
VIYAIARSYLAALCTLVLFGLAAWVDFAFCAEHGDALRADGPRPDTPRGVRFAVAGPDEAIYRCRVRHCALDGAPQILCHDDLVCVCAHAGASTHDVEIRLGGEAAHALCAVVDPAPRPGAAGACPDARCRDHIR